MSWPETREAWLELRGMAAYGAASIPAVEGFERGAAQCLNPRCRKFKSRPSAVCGWCGDDPVSHNGDRQSFDRAYGYA